MASKDLTIRLVGDLSDLQKKLGQASNDMSKFGATMTKKVTPAATAIAAAATVVGNKWNDAVDAIIVGTGASGDALDDLLDTTKRVAGRVPNDFAEVGTAIAEVNTRLGLTGPELEETTTQFLHLSRVTGTDVKTNIGLVTRVFGDWSVATEDQASTMDTLFAATQQTGIGIDRLSALVVQFGAPMRQLGFSLDESIALFGKFEKEGVNIEAVMSGLRMGLGRMAKAGEEPIDTFQRLIEQIKNAGTQGEANAIALEGFGQRAGPDMAAAIREGRFELDDLVAALGNSDGALEDAASRTIHLNDRLRMLGNRITATLGPFGELTGAAAGMVAATGPLLFGLGQMGPALSKVAGAFKTLRTVMAAHPILTIAAVATAAALAMGVFGDAVGDSSKEVDDLAQSMRDAGGPLQGLVNTINKMADENGLLLDVLDQLGLSTLDVARAAMAGGDAWEAMQDRILNRALRVGGTDAAKLGAVLVDLADNAAEAAEKNGQLAKVQGETTRETKRAIEATEDAVDVVEDHGQALRDNAREATYNADAQQELGRIQSINKGIVDRARAAYEAFMRSIKFTRDEVGALKREIDDEQAWLNLQNAMDGAIATMEDGEASARDQRLAVLDLKEEVIDYAEQINLPQRVVTKLVADIDAGKVNEVRMLLAQWGNGVTIPLKPVVINTGSGTSVRVDENGNVRANGYNADGTRYWQGGLSVVGENGPELVNLPRGSQVFSNGESRRMVESAGGGSTGGSSLAPVYNINVTAGLGASGDDIGQAVVDAIRKFERHNGNGWRQ